MKIAIHSILMIACITLDVIYQTCILSFVAGFLLFKIMLLVKEYFINRASRNMWAKFQTGLKDKTNK